MKQMVSSKLKEFWVYSGDVPLLVNFVVVQDNFDLAIEYIVVVVVVDYYKLVFSRDYLIKLPVFDDAVEVQYVCVYFSFSVDFVLLYIKMVDIYYVIIL
jgi:hypothetical protein